MIQSDVESIIRAEFRALVKGNLSVEELLLRPRVSEELCQRVRHSAAQWDWQDWDILRALRDMDASQRT